MPEISHSEALTGTLGARLEPCVTHYGGKQMGKLFDRHDRIIRWVCTCGLTYEQAVQEYVRGVPN